MRPAGSACTRPARAGRILACRAGNAPLRTRARPALEGPAGAWHTSTRRVGGARVAPHPGRAAPALHTRFRPRRCLERQGRTSRACARPRAPAAGELLARGAGGAVQASGGAVGGLRGGVDDVVAWSETVGGNASADYQHGTASEACGTPARRPHKQERWRPPSPSTPCPGGRPRTGRCQQR